MHLRVRVYVRNVKYLFTYRAFFQDAREIAISHSRFYSRVNPAEDFLILSVPSSKPTRSIGLRPISRIGRFSCNSSYRYRIGIVADMADRCRRNVESPTRSRLDVALLDVAVVYRFRFSRRVSHLTFTPFTILLAHPFPHTCRSFSNRFLLLPSNSRMLYSQRGRARLGRASNVGIRYAINDGRLLFHDDPIDTLVLLVVRDRSDVPSYHNAAPLQIELLSHPRNAQT